MNILNFETELEKLINKYSIENGSDTPDFLLTKYLMGCLHNYNSVVNAREDWSQEKCKEKLASTPATPTEAYPKLWTTLYQLARRKTFEDYAKSADDAATQLIADSEARAVAKAVAAIIEKNTPEVAKINAALIALETELVRLRVLFPAICSALGNGAFCTPDVSIGFLESIPNEVASVVARLRAELSAVQAQHLHEVDELAAQAKIMNALRAELATCKDASEALVYNFRAENDRLIDENVKLTARAERAEAEVERLKAPRSLYNIAIDHCTWAEHMPLTGQPIINLLEMDDDCEISLQEIATAPNLRAAIDAATKERSK
jgi:hypothetical protein